MRTTNFTMKSEIDPLLNISDEKVAELLLRIKPLVPNGNDDGKLWEIELPEDLRRTAFRWDPKFTKPSDVTPKYILEEITTYHRCGYIGLFKPDIVEVLAQIPEDLLDQVVAFDVQFNDGPDVIVKGDFYGHKTTTILYRERDKCAGCNGTRGGVAGNGNIINGQVMCDYCS